MEEIASDTADAIKALQAEVSEIGHIAILKRMALDIMLASQDGVCTSCCIYVDQSGRISTNLQEIWKHTKILHEIQKDDTSYVFQEIWNWLVSYGLRS